LIYSLEVNSVYTVDPSSNASALITGSAPVQSLTLWIPQGSQGVPGSGGGTIDTATVRQIANEQISAGGYIVTGNVAYVRNVTVGGKLIVSSGGTMTTSANPFYAAVCVEETGDQGAYPMAKSLATDSNYTSVTMYCGVYTGAVMYYSRDDYGVSSYITASASRAAVEVWKEGAEASATCLDLNINDGAKLYSYQTYPNHAASLTLSSGTLTFDGMYESNDGETIVSRTGTVLVNTDIVSGNSLLNLSSVSSAASSVSIAILSGGTSYEYTQPLTSLAITSMVPNCHAQLLFSMSVDNAVTLPSGTILIPGDFQFTSGRNYILSISGNMVSANTYRIIS
jgi:hypothetical protein